MNNFKFMQKEIAAWQKEGLVSAELASTLSSRYENEQKGAFYFVARIISVIFLFISIILLIAHNWDEMSRLVRFAMVLAVFSVVQAVGLFYLYKSEIWRARVWLFLASLLFGAGIVLVAQIFNLGEHMSDGVLVWALAPLAFGAVFGWSEQLVLALVLGGVYLGMERFMYEASSLLYLAFGAVAMFWYFRARNGVVGVFLAIFMHFVLVLYFNEFILNYAFMTYILCCILMYLLFLGSPISYLSVIFGILATQAKWIFAYNPGYYITDLSGLLLQTFGGFNAILLLSCVGLAVFKKQWLALACALWICVLNIINLGIITNDIIDIGDAKVLLATRAINFLISVLIGVKAIKTGGKLNVLLGGLLIALLAISEYVQIKSGYLGTSLMFLAVAVVILALNRRGK